MKVMSIDASTKSTGVALFDNGKLIDYKNFTESGTDTFRRIKNMTKKIEDYFLEHSPDRIILEEVLPEDVRNNQKTFKPLIYLQSNLVLMFHEYKKTVELVNVNTWRKTLGIPTGMYAKRELCKQKSIELIKKKYGIDANDDVCDAICIGCAGQMGIVNEDGEPSAF